MKISRRTHLSAACSGIGGALTAMAVPVGHLTGSLIAGAAIFFWSCAIYLAR